MKKGDNMKILVVSDTHRNIEKMHLAAQLEKPDLILHLGDHDADAMQLERLLPSANICYVKGNCDSFSDSALTYCHNVDGVRIFAAHGHKYGVKNGLLSFSYAAMEAGAQIALFGHTHIPFCEKRGEMWLMNPGACGGYRASYGIIEIKDGSASCRIVEGNL